MFARRAYVIAIAVLSLCLTLVGRSVPAQGQTGFINDEALARELLAALNDWRASEGIAPLHPNPVLQTMAEDQAVYVDARLTSQASLDFHTDGAGRNPRTRAQQVYRWPTYGTPDQIQIGENAAVGSVRSALNYWRGSEIHRRAALSAVYREIGIAVAPTDDDDFLFMVVFGARPNVLPVLYDPADSTLILTDDRSPYGPRPGANLRARVFNADGVPISPAIDWQPRIPVSAGRTSGVYVLLSGTGFDALAPVDFVRDQVIAGHTLALLPPEPLFIRGAVRVAAPVPIVTAASTPPAATFAPATRVPSATAPPTPTPTRTPFTFVLPSLTPTPSRTPVPTATLTPIPLDRADLLLTYDANGLTLRSVSGPVNLTGVSLTGGGRSLSVTNWTRVAAFSVEAFPRNHCLVVQQSGRSTATSSECAFVRSAITVDVGRVFWTAPFTVMRDSVVIAACSASPCAVDLP